MPPVHNLSISLPPSDSGLRSVLSKNCFGLRRTESRSHLVSPDADNVLPPLAVYTARRRDAVVYSPHGQTRLSQ